MRNDVGFLLEVEGVKEAVKWFGIPAVFLGCTVLGFIVGYLRP